MTVKEIVENIRKINDNNWLQKDIDDKIKQEILAHDKELLDELEKIIIKKEIPKQERIDTVLYCEICNKINGFNEAIVLIKQKISELREVRK